MYQSNDDEETIMKGRVSVGVYVKYFRAGGGIFLSLIVFLIAIISRVCICYYFATGKSQCLNFTRFMGRYIKLSYMSKKSSQSPSRTNGALGGPYLRFSSPRPHFCECT